MKSNTCRCRLSSSFTLGVGLLYVGFWILIFELLVLVWERLVVFLGGPVGGSPGCGVDLVGVGCWLEGGGICDYHWDTGALVGGFLCNSYIRTFAW